MSLDFLAGAYCGGLMVATAWVATLCFRRRRPPKQVIYRKGFPPEVIA